MTTDSKQRTRVLTGITTTGTPHLGNYVGAIRPTVQASRNPATQGFYFLADYHALIKCDDPARIQRSTLEIAASWIAAGLDPDGVMFYRQSDIPEIPELTWLLTCVTGKGMLNRAHAYKASVDKNNAAGNDPDADVTAGLFMYPVLMGADILMFKAHKVPVGRDQIQHIEMARDMASSFNHLYGEHLVLPEAVIEESVALLPGLDGRKMSKSYDNTIPLFSSSAQLKKLISGIVTDSRAPGEAKDTEGSALFQIYQAFASAEETATLAKAYADGIGWGDAKQILFERIDREVAPMRAKYEELINNPASVDAILLKGAAKARELATPFIKELRHAVGLRTLASAASSQGPAKTARAASPSFKQYREQDGQFYFKLVDTQGRVLLQSLGFASPKDAGMAIAQLQQDDAKALAALGSQVSLGEGVSAAVVAEALATLRAELAEKAKAKA
jgi:tryptophanyl-tRNA synthetase